MFGGDIHLTLSVDSAAIIALCGVLTTALTILNNVITAIASARARRNAIALATLHDCLDNHAEKLGALITESASNSDRITVMEGERHASDASGLRSDTASSGPAT